MLDIPTAQYETVTAPRSLKQNIYHVIVLLVANYS